MNRSMRPAILPIVRPIIVHRFLKLKIAFRFTDSVSKTILAPGYIEKTHLPNLSETMPDIAAPMKNETKVIDEIMVAIICLSHSKLYSIRAEYKPSLTIASSNS